MTSAHTMPPPTTGIASPQIVNGLMVNQRSQQQQRYINILKGLGIAEVSLGSFCLFIGAIALHGAYTIGEATWCGAMIIVAGGLGIGVGKKGSTPCFINVHLAFSIVGVLFAGFLVVAQSIQARFAYFHYPRGPSIAVVVAAFIAMILQIVSAVYCCYANHGCCKGCDTPCCPIEQPQIGYVINSTQISGQYQTTLPQMEGCTTIVHPQTQQAFYVVSQPQSQPQQPQQQQPQTLEESNFQTTSKDNDNNLLVYENAIVLGNNSETIPLV